MKLRLIMVCFALLISMVNFAQSPTSSLYGQIAEEINNEAIIGATVFYISAGDTLGTTSDIEGKFEFLNVPIGRASIQVSHLGYADYQNNELLLESGRQLEIKIKLRQAAEFLPETIVRGSGRAAESIAATSIQTLTIEEVRRFPATFNDPARLALAYPGVANSNDQANELIIRGNSPAGVAWKIEGAEIVNPNHLSNAGNEFDRVSDSGGGVNALSAQMLKNSYLLTGAFPAQYGNALAGVMDMNLRPGNKNKWESTIQLGLLGLDFAIEAPFSKNKNSSFLINYRYSTIGLLDLLGVPVSDESISFQDLAVHLNFPTEKMGDFSVFGIGGKSSNVFQGSQDTATWNFRRDRSIIDYQSSLGVLGGSHQKNFKKAIWKNTVVYSTAINNRAEGYFQNGLDFQNEIPDSLRLSKLSIHSFVNYYPNKTLTFRFGLESNHQDASFFPVLDFPSVVARRNQSAGWLIQPYFSANYQLSSKLGINAGFRFMHSTINGQTAALPRLNLSYNFSKTDRTVLSWGTQSRETPFYISLLKDQNFGFIKADHIVLSHKHLFKNSSFIKAELYHESLYEVPSAGDGGDNFSALNVEEAYVQTLEDLQNFGVGQNKGVEISWQQYLQKDFYFLISGSLFDSKSRANAGPWRNTRYNSKFLFNATSGKEFNWQGKWPRTFGVNLHITAVGGQWYTPIDLAASQAANQTQYFSDQYFSAQLPTYAKVDLRLYIRTSKTKRSTSLSLDIQNITNRKNIAFYFYDVDRQTIERKDQLGLIPVLNWRVEL